MLVGLMSSNPEVQHTSVLACHALAVHHPRACLRLLPSAAGLSEGRLDLSQTLITSGPSGAPNLAFSGLDGNGRNASAGAQQYHQILHLYGQFKAKRYHEFFFTLLRLLELLAGIDLNAATSDMTPPDGWWWWRQRRNDQKHYQVSTTCPSHSTPPLFSEEAMWYSSSIDRILANLINVTARFHCIVRRYGIPGRLARLLYAYAKQAPWFRATGSLFAGRGISACSPLAPNRSSSIDRDDIGHWDGYSCRSDYVGDVRIFSDVVPGQLAMLADHFYEFSDLLVHLFPGSFPSLEGYLDKQPTEHPYTLGQIGVQQSSKRLNLSIVQPFIARIHSSSSLLGKSN
ncbi:unnamed protein product [Protopolystoma xenopodis]|uniref:Uncharacterized protein n=1 Tax=Protopolystoma xenopodis TaxID=117903 RepID=A0A3S5CGQ6_9PLAT|nr:unnamed protein product [Protopolystoma xenopodis]